MFSYEQGSKGLIRPIREELYGTTFPDSSWQWYYPLTTTIMRIAPILLAFIDNKDRYNSYITDHEVTIIWLCLRFLN